MKRIGTFLLLVCLLANLADAQEKYAKFIFKKDPQQESYFQRFLKLFQQQPFHGSYALVIAIGDYEQLQRLQAPPKDADKVKTFLLGTGDYDEVVVLRDADASFETIRYFMQTYFPGKMMQNGRYRFLFYFSGHGTQQTGYGGSTIGYLQLQGATGDLNDSDAIDMQQIQLWADRFRYATHILFLLDCCFSGLAGVEVKDGSYDTSVNPSDLANENGRYMITAGQENQTSVADSRRWGGSLFTDVVLSGMSGKADNNGDGVVTTYELFSYTQAAVRNEAKKVGRAQNPVMHNFGIEYKDTGQYFFVYKAPQAKPITAVMPKNTPEQKGPAAATPTLIATPTVKPTATPTPKPTATPTPPSVVLRHISKIVAKVDATREFNVEVEGGGWRPRISIDENNFERIGEVVIDHTTGLTWQQTDSPDLKTYQDAQDYIKELNRKCFAGYKDWRLPTMPELMSLLKLKKQSDGKYIDPIFTFTHSTTLTFGCWSADYTSSNSAWSVNFGLGIIISQSLNNRYPVRSVRSGQDKIDQCKK